MKNVDTVGDTEIYGLHTANHNDIGNPHPQYAYRGSGWAPVSLGVLGMTFGNSTLEAFRRADGDLVSLWWKLTIGSTASAGSYLAFNRPTGDPAPLGGDKMYAGSGVFIGVSGTVQQLVTYQNAGGSFLIVKPSGQVNSMATDDVFSGLIQYRY